ncbi:MAG: hypothetical protein ACYDC1_10395 [Limisphaerales bacterium]
MAAVIHRWRSRLRLWSRILLALLVGALAMAALIVAGWRWGWTPLPEPVEGFAFRSLTAGSAREGTTNTCWFWVREFDRRLRGTIEAQSLADLHPATLDAWARSDAQSSPVQIEVFRALRGNRDLEECFQGFISSAPAHPSDDPISGELRAVGLLGSLPLVRAADAEREGRTGVAFAQLVEAWRFKARFQGTPWAEQLYDERGDAQVNHTLARPWRRLALNSPRLDVTEGRRLLADLEAVTRSLPDLGALYLQRVSDAAVELDEARSGGSGGWRRVRLSFQQGSRLMAHDVLTTVGDVFGAFAGWPRRENHTRGIAHLARPGQLLFEVATRTVARKVDIEQARAALFSRALARLANSNAADAASAWDPGLPPSTLRRWLDRPAVWRDLGRWPSPDQIREARGRWLYLLQSCRLTLALRLYRDTHGEWPTSLEALVPAWLPSAVMNPLTGRPFEYRVTAGGWQIQPGVGGKLDPRDLEAAELGFGSRQP